MNAQELNRRRLTYQRHRELSIIGLSATALLAVENTIHNSKEQKHERSSARTNEFCKGVPSSTSSILEARTSRLEGLGRGCSDHAGHGYLHTDAGLVCAAWRPDTAQSSLVRLKELADAEAARLAAAARKANDTVFVFEKGKTVVLRGVNFETIKRLSHSIPKISFSAHSMHSMPVRISRF